jgi:hypothetical protein
LNSSSLRTENQNCSLHALVHHLWEVLFLFTKSNPFGKTNSSSGSD